MNRRGRRPMEKPAESPSDGRPARKPNPRTMRLPPESGEQLSAVRIVNDPVALGLQLEEAGRDPEVVLEATYGWYWAVDVLQACGARVHLAHPLGVKGFRYRRVKNDVPSCPTGSPPALIRLRCRRSATDSARARSRCSPNAGGRSCRCR